MIKSLIGVTFLSALAAQSLSAQTAATEFSITPRLSHNYTRVKLTSTVTDQTTGEKLSGEGEIYTNALRYDVELAWNLNEALSLLVDVGYQPNFATSSEVLEMYNYELGLRSNFAGAYAQVSFGQQTYNNQGQNFDPDSSFNLPVAGIGLGYIYPINDVVGIEIFYRGYISLKDSNSQKFARDYDSIDDIEYSRADVRINQIENHQAGLGANFKF